MRCAKCGKEIVGEAVLVGGKEYHLACAPPDFKAWRESQGQPLDAVPFNTGRAAAGSQNALREAAFAAQDEAPAVPVGQELTAMIESMAFKFFAAQTELAAVKAERDELAERVHYAEGTAEANIQRANEAEAAIQSSQPVKAAAVDGALRIPNLDTSISAETQKQLDGIDQALWHGAMLAKGVTVAALASQPAGEGEAARYATRLLLAIAEKHYPEWTPNPLPDLLGVLTQIDNLTSGLVRSVEGEAVGYVSDYGLAQLAKRAHRYSLEVSKAAENEYTNPLYARPAAEGDAVAWIVGNGDGTMWRMWTIEGPIWTWDRDRATRYARRVDAESVHAEDEGAWTVVPYSEPSAHDWFTYKNMECCQKCGNVRNETSDSRPCKGHVSVGLRDPRPAAADAGVREALRETSKIYLASRYSRFPEMQKVRADLEAMGYTVTSRWINGGHELTKEGSTEAHEAERVRYAQEDFEDLLAADTVISFTEVPRETKTRGGRHVEHGMALALGKRTIVIGWRENVFHCLPQCEFFADWAAAALSLAAKRGQDNG